MMALPVPVAEGCDGEHLVQFYDTERFLVDTASEFVASALWAGDAAIVMATASHRNAVEAALRASGIDVTVAGAADRYVAVDAAVLLDELMFDRAPDPERFRAVMVPLIERAATGGRRLRVFGEMAALLWDAGDVASTLALERLLNDLELTHQLSRLCAYPIHAFERQGSANAFKQICGRHTKVIPGEAYSLLDSPDQRQRVVAQLQQENAALRADAARLRAEYDSSEHPHGDALTGLAKRRASDLLETAEQVTNLGSWEWLPETGAHVWSANLYRIYGVEPGEITPTREFVLGRAHPDDRQRLATELESGWRTPDPPTIEYRIQRQAGDVRYLRSMITSVDADSFGTSRIVGMVQDVTNQRITSRELAARVATSAALVEWGAFEDGAMRLLRDLGKACEFSVGALWLPHGDVLAAELIWSEPWVEIDDFESLTLALRLPRGVSLPGLAWQSKRPEIIVDVSHKPSFRRSEVARAAGLNTGVAFVALKAQEVLAVLEFYSGEQDDPDRLTRTLAAIGSELGEFFSRRRGELAPPRLTPRELQILQLAALGNAAPRIAQSLSIGASTVKTHMENMYRKLGVSDRAAAVATGLRLGIIN
jgi:DNA-binding CsgD family transcriptional regulator/PAS domain-containing protein